MLRPFNWLAAVVLLLSCSGGFASETWERDALRIEIENLAQAGALSSGVEIAAGDLLAEFYERRGFTPAWTSTAKVAELLAAIEASYADGLNPEDYFVDAVRAAYTDMEAGRPMDRVDSAVRDILLTESLIRLGYHEKFGKVNPYTLDSNWNFRRDLDGVDPAVTLQKVIDATSLTEALREIFPRGEWYRDTRDALQEYRRIQAAGGWPQVPAGPILRPGEEDARAALLGQRLLVTGDLDEGVAGPFSVYDKQLEEGVRRFQQRHSLDVDGVVGPATVRAMNVPVEQRIQQLRLSLERSRWVTDDLEGDFILVNIPGFYAVVERDGEVVWRSRVQVGRAYRRTPVFRDQMRYLVFNPTWTAPFNLATRDVLPRVQRDPDYLKRQGFDVLDRNGDIIDPSTVDWTNVTRSTFRYTFVQRPGPLNAMGQVKFMFPNRYSVYLHDTPSTQLFDRGERAFSAGCIRVAKPLELAEELLAADNWDRARIEKVLEGGQLTNVNLSQPIPVFLLYWTAEVGEDGLVYFYNDVYQRDQAIAAELEEAFTLDVPST